MVENKVSIWETIRRHLMTGIGYMIPIVTGASLVKAIAQTIITLFNINTGAAELGVFAAFLNWITSSSADGFLGLMYPILGGYIAYSIADRNGIAVGMAAGYIGASGRSGFLGALLGGFIAGYFIKFLADRWKVGRQWRTLMMFMIYPLIGSVLMFTVMYFIIEPIGGFINSIFTSFINYVGNFGVIPMYAVLAGMMASDCGGPINKAAFAISFTLAGAGFPATALICGAMVAPLGFGCAALIDKFITKKNVLNEELQAAGLSSFIMGLFNITEGAIPIVLSDPGFMVVVNIIGSAISAIAEHLAGNEVYLTGPSGNVLGWFAQPNPISWILCLFTGPLFIALCTLWRQGKLKNKAEAVQTEETTAE